MRISTATAWSSGAVGRAHAARHCRRGWLPTICGVPSSKGEFKLGNGRYCFPLNRQRSRRALRAVVRVAGFDARRPAVTAFERLFRERSLPPAIRSDQGVPFASPNPLFNLSCG